jgi:hypothetical protein
MKQTQPNGTAEQHVREIRRQTRKKRLAGDTERQASSGEVKDLRREMGALKELVADLTIENRLLKRAPLGMGATPHEIPRLGEARDHPAGRGIEAAGEAHAREARYLTVEVLPVVRPAPAYCGRRVRQ